MTFIELFNSTELMLAYKRLKSFSYRDGADLHLRRKIGEFENDIESQEHLEKKLWVVIEDVNTLLTQHIRPKWLDEIDYQVFPKKVAAIRESQVETYIKSFESTTDFKLSRILCQIKAGVEVHFISFLWCSIVGAIFDKSLSQNVYSNRLFKDKDSDVLQYSSKLFRPYYEDYGKWRDNAIEQVRSAHSRGNDATIISLDIKDYYYSVDLDLKTLANNLLWQSIEMKDEKQTGINLMLAEIHSVYRDRIGAKLNLLPIGLISSGILGNFALCEIDEEVMSEINPAYYGRYVDDILMVVQNLKISDHNFEESLKRLFKNNTRIKFSESGEQSPDKTIKSARNTSIRFETSFGIYSAQTEKLKIFDFSSSSPLSLLTEFEKDIENFSSEGRMLAEDMDFLERFSSDSKTIGYTDSVLKLRSIDKFNLDKLRFSRFLNRIIQTSKVTSKITEEDFKNIHEQIMSIINGQDAISTYRIWEKLTCIYVSHKRFSELEELILRIMESIHTLNIPEHPQKYLPPTINPPGLMSTHLRFTWYLFLSRTIVLSFAAAGGYTDLSKLLVGLGDQRPTLDPSMNKSHRTIIKYIFRHAEHLIALLRNSSMFRHHNCPVPMVAFCEGIEKLDFNSLRDSFGKLGGGKFQWKISKRKVDLAPRFINYGEISELHILHSLLEHRPIGLSDLISKTNKDFTDFNKISDLSSVASAPNVDQDRSDIEDATDSVDKIPITNLKINDEKRNSLRIGIANVDISHTSFELRFAGCPDLSHDRLISLNRILNLALHEKVDLLVFPETFIPFEWLDYVASFCKINRIAIIAGLEHVIVEDQVYNFILNISPFRMNEQNNVLMNLVPKADLNADELDLITSVGLRAGKVSYQKVKIQWRGACMSLLNCLELSDIRKRSWMRGHLDILIAIENNRDTSYFSSIVESTARDLHCYVVQVNNSLYGDSRITGPLPSGQRDLLRIKGGQNKTVLVQDVPVNDLRKFHHFRDAYGLLGGRTEFKPPSPGFPRSTDARKPHYPKPGKKK